MTILYAWMKQVVFFIIFMALFYQLIPNERYKSFVRLTGGFLFLLFMLSPILRLFRMEGTLEQHIRSFQFQQENREFVWRLQNAGIKAYEPLLEEGLENMAQDKKVSLTYYEPVWESGTLTGIRLSVTYKRIGTSGEEAKATPVVEELREEIAAVYALPKEAVTITLEE